MPLLSIRFCRNRCNSKISTTTDLYGLKDCLSFSCTAHLQSTPALLSFSVGWNYLSFEQAFLLLCGCAVRCWLGRASTKIIPANNYKHLRSIRNCCLKNLRKIIFIWNVLAFCCEVNIFKFCFMSSFLFVIFLFAHKTKGKERKIQNYFYAHLKFSFCVGS